MKITRLYDENLKKEINPKDIKNMGIIDGKIAIIEFNNNHYIDSEYMRTLTTCKFILRVEDVKK